MMSKSAFSKIWIIVILVVLVTGGIFTWKYFVAPEEETGAPEEIVKDETADWQTYRNEEYGYEIKYPENWKVAKNIFRFEPNLVFCPLNLADDPNPKVICRLKTDATKPQYEKGMIYLFAYDSDQKPANPKYHYLGSTGGKYYYLYSQDNELIVNQMLSTFRFIGVPFKKEKLQKSYIKLLSPNGGEELKKGSTHRIKWNSEGLEGEVVDILLRGYDDRGNLIYPQEVLIYENIPAITLGGLTAYGVKGIEFWEIPLDIEKRFQKIPVYYKMKIICLDRDVSDESDNYFSIVERKPHPSINEIDIFLFKDFKTCIVGDKCTTGGDKCIRVTRKDDVDYLEFEDNDNFKALKPNDPTINHYQQKICLNPVLDNTEIDYLKNEVNQFISEVNQWTNGSISLSPKFIEISGEIEMTKCWKGLYAAPWNSESLIKSYITKNTDFVIVSHDMYDDALDVVIPVSACGGTLGNDVGIGGAGYNWVPKTHPGCWFECGNKGTFMHEWLNLMDWVLLNTSGVNDIYNIYNGNYPACGKGDPNTYLWFPSASYDSTKDPDFEACGQNWDNYCKSVEPKDCNLIWHKHILTKHYNPDTNLIGNYCRNGKQDFDETGRDCGGKCFPCM